MPQSIRHILGTAARFTILPHTAVRASTAMASAGLLGSYLVTWELWAARTSPPNLPVVGALSAFPFGPALVITAVLAPFLLRSAATAHALLLMLAVLGDQTRLQPEFVSLAILLLAGAWPPKSVEVARWHLIALWGWAGMHKLLSAGWPSGGALFIAGAAGDSRLQPAVAILVPICELGLAALALSVRTWRILRILAVPFHLGIVMTLYRIGWNTAVWPWNLVLAAAPFFLFRSIAVGDERERNLPPRSVGEPRRADWRSRAVTAAAVLLVVYPAGFYVGKADAYIAHNLYSSNTSEASVCPAEPDRSCVSAPFSTWDALNVPLPPERRIFVAWFNMICEPGQRLKIDGIWTRLYERRTEYVGCPRSAV